MDTLIVDSVKTTFWSTSTFWDTFTTIGGLIAVVIVLIAVEFLIHK